MEINALSQRFQHVRQWTETLCRPLTNEDYVPQSMPDCSPIKWHLAHTSWFFDCFVLRHQKKDKLFHPQFDYLFNSYYGTIGACQPRFQRGLLTRPLVEEVFAYRRYVDEQIQNLLAAGADEKICALIELGVNHEQQHQELILTDVKHLFFCNPLRPIYAPKKETHDPTAECEDKQWQHFDEGLRNIGANSSGFAFDNERPQHRFFVPEFSLQTTLVTNQEYLEFINDGGYRRSELWLSDGDICRQQDHWEAPLYWEQRDQEWWQFTLHGMQKIKADEPVCHLSYYEADAFSRWKNARLPSEEEWETAANLSALEGNFVESQHYHPRPPSDTYRSMQQLFGDVWEWTASSYTAYPGFQPLSGSLGEYNGKFMCNQIVLRGGSCVSPQSHLRASYRNFFPPHTRWQFSGLRLAKSR